MNDAFHHFTLAQLSAVVIINSYTCYYCTFFNDDVSVMRQPHKRIYAQNIMLRYNNNKYNRNLWTVKAELEFVILIFQIQFIRRYSIEFICSYELFHISPFTEFDLIIFILFCRVKFIFRLWSFPAAFKHFPTIK